MGKYIRLVAVTILLLILGGGYYWLVRTDDNVSMEPTEASVGEVSEQKQDTVVFSYVAPENPSRITGEACDQPAERALAIMYSGDVETRPYFSGIADASFVVEMDHRYTHGGTRVMGIFDCVKPDFVGPMRSGRVDFLNVAAAFDAIYVPWGGDSTSKSLLKKSVHDHIDCNSEVYPGGNQASCFRRSVGDIPLGKEDRAFSSAKALLTQAKILGYRQGSQFIGFEHQGDAQLDERPFGGSLEIGLQPGFRVRYDYNRENNSYERFFEGAEEFDFDSKERVAPKNVIVISSKKGTFRASGNTGTVNPWDGVDAQHRQNDAGQYPNFALGDAWFDVSHEGTATFYIDGQEIQGTWKKKPQVNAPFEFYHHTGRKMKFTPGQIWLHVVDTNRIISWQNS